MNQPTVAVIIPAYNEESTIATVVRTACSSTMINEVVVVSDGSTDKTSEMARQAGATVYDLETNRGKGQAMLFGFYKTDADIVLFLDADLIRFSTEHIQQLLDPVIRGECMMNVGMRDRGLFFTAFAHLFPLVSGERVMKREVFKSVPEKFLKGFMIEIALNHFCRLQGHRVGVVNLKKLSIRRKYQKVGFFKAVVQYLRMFFQIVYAIVMVRSFK